MKNNCDLNDVNIVQDQPKIQPIITTIQFTGLTMPHYCVCLKSGSEFPVSCHVLRFEARGGCWVS